MNKKWIGFGLGIVVLMGVWANVHGAFLLGLFTLIAYALGAVSEALLGKRKLRPAPFVLVGAAAAASWRRPEIQRD